MKSQFILFVILIAVLDLSMVACSSNPLLGSGANTPTSVPPTPTPACTLNCNINSESYAFDITCESGSVNNEMSNSTSMEYSPSGEASKAIVSVNQKQTYSGSGNTYYITGVITSHILDGYADYDIQATGGVFGTTPQSCRSDNAGSVNPVSTAPALAPPTEFPSPTAAGIPVVHSVELRRDTSMEGLVIYQDVNFTDSDGDVTHWDFEIVSSTNSDINTEGGELHIPSAQQKTGAVATGKWTCGNEIYSVTLSVTLTDKAGHQSVPYKYTMDCDGGK